MTTPPAERPDGGVDEDRPTPNPLGESPSILVTMPQAIEVQLVDASVLRDYEVWILVTTVFLSAAVGSFVAWAGDVSQGHLGVVGGVFLVAAGATGAMVVTKRKVLSRRKQVVRYPANAAVVDPALDGDRSEGKR